MPEPPTFTRQMSIQVKNEIRKAYDNRAQSYNHYLDRLERWRPPPPPPPEMPRNGKWRIWINKYPLRDFRWAYFGAFLFWFGKVKDNFKAWRAGLPSDATMRSNERTIAASETPMTFCQVIFPCRYQRVFG
eukprot:Blabericola_migrator_1__332@NODE_1085_length_5492_cov_16_106544_g743_i0_p6_GENE_NODE_1085_length_5492_cov_16_106544_g743_i0NODE_1085_length_5492_cov_16_106544_g743_i0_p6_ORF_typecomplete_len131_score23_16_NODE_1085_length_5492_cov_16_106544_g743_i049705362